MEANNQPWWFNFKYAVVGIFFGIIFVKAEIISWYRIQEMFRLQSFHMYGVIGSAVILGIIQIKLIKKSKLKSLTGEEITIAPKDSGWLRYIIGGTLFGLGWALIGACPGPMFILIGTGSWVFIFVVLAATFGTFVYGLLKDKLPH